MTMTTESLAHALLELIVKKYRRRAGDFQNAVTLNIDFCTEYPGSDFSAALGYANEQGWVEPGRQPGFIRLTETGYEEVVNFDSMCNEIIAIEKKDGTRHENVKAAVGSVIILPNDKLPLEYGDIALRTLPGGVVQRLFITDPGYNPPSSLIGTRGHYQARFKHEAAINDSRALNVQMNGPNARFNMNSVDNSTNTVQASELNFPVLTEEFAHLREALYQKKPTTAEQFNALAKIAEAEEAAKSENPLSVTNALIALGKVAGKWAYETAIEVGAKTTAELIIKCAGG